MNNNNGKLASAKPYKEGKVAFIKKKKKEGKVAARSTTFYLHLIKPREKREREREKQRRNGN